MFPDVSIDDFIYREKYGLYEKPNTNPPQLGYCDIELSHTVYSDGNENTILQFYNPYIDNAIGPLGEIIGKIRTLDDFYKTCGYTFTNEDIVKMTIPVPRHSKNVYNYIVLFNEGGQYRYYEENYMTWAEGADHLKYIHTGSPDYYISVECLPPVKNKKVKLNLNCGFIFINNFKSIIKREVYIW